MILDRERLHLLDQHLVIVNHLRSEIPDILVLALLQRELGKVYLRQTALRGILNETLVRRSRLLRPHYAAHRTRNQSSRRQSQCCRSHLHLLGTNNLNLLRLRVPRRELSDRRTKTLK